MSAKRFLQPIAMSAALLLSAIGILLSLTGFAPANATYGSGPTCTGSSCGQTIGGSVDTVDKCAYSISGISTTLSLTKDKTYNPDNSSLTTLTGTDTGVVLSAYPNGDASVECSFYGSSSPGKMVVSIPSSPTWTGTISGTTLTWSNSDSSKAMTITPSKGADCTSAGATATTQNLYTGQLSATLVSITSSSSPKGCTVTNVITTKIPAGLNAPQGAKTYSMTGPTVTYTLSLS